MAYHLIPFVAGAVVGGLAVYLFRDAKVRDDLRQSATSISRKVQQTAGEVSGKVSKGLSQVRESMPGRSREATRAAVQADAEAAPPAPRTSARRTTSRKTAPRRATAESVKPDDN